MKLLINVISILGKILFKLIAIACHVLVAFVLLAFSVLSFVIGCQFSRR